MAVSTESFAREYPFESHHLDLDGARLHYLDEGRGEAVLMLHGNPTWSFFFRHLVAGLRDEFRCLVPDHIGCGLSDRPRGYEYRLDGHIDNVERLVDSLGIESLNLVVHDWGGPIGFGFALRRPEAVRRMVIYNTSAFLSSHIPLSINLCRLPVFGDVAIRGLNLFAREAFRRCAVKDERKTPAVRAGYLAPYGNWTDRAAVLGFVRDIPMKPGDKSYATMKAIEEGISRFRDRPIMVCWGGQDFCFDEMFLGMFRERLPGAEYHVFDDAGHYLLEDAHEKIVPVTREFLERNKSESKAVKDDRQ